MPSLVIKTLSCDANSRSPLRSRSSAPLSLSTFDTLAEAGRWWPTCVPSFRLNYKSGGGKSCQLHLYAAVAKKTQQAIPATHTNTHLSPPPRSTACINIGAPHQLLPSNLTCFRLTRLSAACTRRRVFILMGSRV